MHDAQSLMRAWGHDIVEMLARGSRGHYIKIPIMGSLCATYDGDIVPRDVIPGSGGFSSLSDLIAEATTGGKRQDCAFFKGGLNGAAGIYSSLWARGTYPAAGSYTALPGGSAPTRTTTGALGQQNAASGDTLHIASASVECDQAPMSLLVFDLLFAAGSIDHTSTSSQAITGVPTRYTGTDARGNFCFLTVTTNLGATASNVTVTYVDQDGNTAETSPADVVTVSLQTTRICHDPYFIALNAGDTGLRNATAVQFSAANSAGVSALCIGHPLCWMACPTDEIFHHFDFINTAFNLPQVEDNAAVTFLDLSGQSTGAAEWTGHLIMVSG